MAHIAIATYCDSKLVSRGDGALVRRAVEKHWDDNEPLLLDFSGVRVASVSFFDEALGLLARKFPLDEIRVRVRVENIDPTDRALLNRIVIARAREREVLQPE